MDQSSSRGSGGDRPRVVLFEDVGDNSLDAQSELDLDLYDTDEVDSPNHQHPGLSLSGLPSILNRDSVGPSIPPSYARAAPIKEHQPSDVSSQQRTYQDSASSGGGSSSTRRLYSTRPVNPHPTIRTNFTTAATSSRGDGSSTPYLGDNYEQISTPPGDPILPQPEELVHPEIGHPIRKELSMRAEWVIGLVIVGLGIGIAIASQSPNAHVGYWFSTIGDLYVRMTACITLPMAFCQVITSSAELVNNQKLRRAWRYTALYFVLTAFLSSWLGIACAAAFQSRYERHTTKSYRMSHPNFAFKCADGHYIEMQPNSALGCTGKELNSNTTFPRMVDINQRLGLEDTVGNVDVHGYIFAMIDVFFPQNVIKSLARDDFLSALIVAVVLGISVGKSYTSGAGEIRRSRNPLFRLFTHVYLSLFVMSEWVQAVALWATVPILVGYVVSMPDIAETLSLARYYIVSVLMCGFGQCLVIVPIIFYIVVRQNPYRWLGKMLAPISYGMVLQNAFLSLQMSTKAALRSNEISPSVFGAVYPLLSALNRSHYAIGCPTAVIFAAGFSGCSIEMTAGNVFFLFGVSILGCFGDTMLPQTGMAYFLMIWRSFCQNEDTPSSILMLANITIIIFRLSACVGNATNLLLIRIISHAVERDDARLQQMIDNAFHHRDSASEESSTPIAARASN